MPAPDEQARLIGEQDVLQYEQAQRFAHARDRRTLPAEEPSRYPALKLVAGLCQFLAIALLFLAILGLAIVVPTQMPELVKVQTVVLLAAILVLGPVFLWGLGELILLFIDMAHDMRATRQEITRLRRKRTLG